jgi:hypothetical protein
VTPVATAAVDPLPPHTAPPAGSRVCVSLLRQGEGVEWPIEDVFLERPAYEQLLRHRARRDCPLLTRLGIPSCIVPVDL